jgi:type IV pilus assembly protein PilC
MRPILTHTGGAMLFRQLAAATRNNLPYRDTFEILVQDPDMFGRETPVAQALLAQLQDGAPLSATLRNLPDLVAAETALLVETAEQQGNLAEVLDAIADDYTELTQRKNTVRAALLWPLVVGSALAAMTAIVTIFVLPAFSELFDNFGGELPLPTRFLIGVSDVRIFLPLLVLAVVLGVLAWRGTLRGAGTAAQFVLLSLPFARRYFDRAFAARLAIWLSATHRHPALVQAAVRHLRVTTRMTLYAAALLELENRLAASVPLSQALTGLRGLPRRLALLAQLGERMQDSSAPLAQAADFAEAEREQGLALFERGLVLTVYLVLGIAVAILVIALYLPIFQMGSVI